jgi:hypothetical protein
MKITLSLILFFGSFFITHAQCDSSFTVLKTTASASDTISPQFLEMPIQIPRSLRLCGPNDFLELRAKLSEQNTFVKLEIISPSLANNIKVLYYHSVTESLHINTLYNCKSEINLEFGAEYIVRLTPIDAAGNVGKTRTIIAKL